MKTLIFTLLFVCSFAHAKYENAIVFPGGGLQTAMFLGMLEGAELAGVKPDIILSSCGGSVAATIAHAIENSERRKNFVESKEFYSFLKTLRLTDNAGIVPLLSTTLKMRYFIYLSDSVPDFFSNFIMDVPQEMVIPGITKSFDSTSQIKALMVSARLRFSPSDIGTLAYEDRKLFTEVYFTDQQTASLLEGFTSPIFDEFKDSAISKYTEVHTDLTTTQAMRASIADPYYISPFRHGESYFVTGAVDLYPIEAAHRVAEKVIFPFASEFDTIVEQAGIQSSFRYDNNKRLRKVTDQQADVWVDFSEVSKMYSISGFNPQPSITGVEMTIPESYDQFVRKVREQWNWGKQKALEAFAAPIGSKAHIRNMNKDNASLTLRRKYNRLEN
ncbi:MAG: patatin-like phospholipase family protein [Bacteriovoracia bacterium]